MKINEYFDKVVCINLDHRKDRWEEAEAQFKRAGLAVQRVSAVNGNPMGWERAEGAFVKKEHSFDGNMGCIASHVNVWKEAKEKGYKSVLIIEDDCDFIDRLQERFRKTISQVPEDWDLLYFGGVHETRGDKIVPDRIAPNVMRAKRMITTTCYAIKDTLYDTAIDACLKTKPVFNKPIDGYLAVDVQPHCNTYSFHPPYAWQRGSFSDIQKGHRDYSKMMKNDNFKRS